MPWAKDAQNFDLIYRHLLHDTVRGGGELINASFCLQNPALNLVKSKKRAFRQEFAERFFQWIWNGESDISLLFKDNPNAKRFEPEAGGRNTAYGPRILEQLPDVMEELRENRFSRRACILILLPEDRELLFPKRKGEIKTEYPCTIAYTLFLREGRHGHDLSLHLHSAMRSNNVTTTLCYDVYNACRMMEEVMHRLRSLGLDVHLGTYQHNMVSAHVVPSERSLACDILEEYGYDDADQYREG